MTTPSQRRDKSKDLALVGTVLAGKYRVLQLLGQGGFGSVFLVEIIAGMVGEKLALKLLPADLSKDEKVKGQFINEIRVAMRMVNKYIVQIRDIGESEAGQLYYTMDYCPGETLAVVLKREGKLAPTRAIGICLRILDALKTAHAAGVIHRDLKPANVMAFMQDGHETVRVLDFGIATAIGAVQKTGGGFVGSPHYMPPEQFLNEELGFYTDTYAMGVILYECITGQKPYHGKTPQEVYNDLKKRPVVPPEQVNPELAALPELSRVVLRALERNPDLRFPTAKDFFTELKAVLEPKAVPPPAAAAAPRRRRSSMVVRPQKNMASGAAIGVGVAVALLAVVLFVVLKPPPAGAPPPPNGGNNLVAIGKKDAAPSPKDPEPDPSDPAPTPPQDPAPPPRGDKSEKPAKAPDEVRPDASKVALPSAEDKKKSDAEQAARFLGEAAALAKTGDWDKVREKCLDALKLDLESAQGHRLLGMACLKLNMFPDAVNALDEARKRTPPEKVDAGLLLLSYDAQAGLPTPDAAILDKLRTDALRAWKRDPQGAEALVKLLGLVDADGNEKEVLALLAEAEKQKVEDAKVTALRKKWLEDLPKEREGKALEILKAAKEDFEKDDFAAAATKADQGFKLRPLPDLGFLLVESYRELGKPREMLKALEELGAVTTEPDSLARVGILYAAAHLADYEAGGRKGTASIEKALTNLNAALDILKAPKAKELLVASAHTYRARCFAYQGNLAKVEDEIAAAKTVHDRDPALIFNQAESLYFLGEKVNDPDRSAAFQKAISRLFIFKDLKDGSRDAKGWYLFGLCYVKLGGKADNFNKAKDSFSKAQLYGMKDRPELYDAWAEAFLGLGKYMNAGQKYRESFGLKPTSESCSKAAQCFIEAGNTSSARKVLQEGLDKLGKDPKLQGLLQSLGR